MCNARKYEASPLIPLDVLSCTGRDGDKLVQFF